MRQSRTISLPAREISLFAKQRISLTYKAEKRESYRSVSVFLSLLFLLPVSHLFYKCTGLCPYPCFISPIRTSPYTPCLFYFVDELGLTQPCKRFDIMKKTHHSGFAQMMCLIFYLSFCGAFFKKRPYLLLACLFDSNCNAGSHRSLWVVTCAEP